MRCGSKQTSARSFDLKRSHAILLGVQKTTFASHRLRGERQNLGTAELVRIDSASELQLDSVLQFMRVLWALVHELQKTSKRMRRQLGVTGPQRLVLRVVGLSSGMSAGTLAKVLHVHPSTLTGVFRRLQSQGLLRRYGDPRDARRSVFQLSAKGARVNRAFEGTVEAAVGRALKQHSMHHQQHVRTFLSTLVAQLGTGAARLESRPRRRVA